MRAGAAYRMEKAGQPFAGGRHANRSRAHRSGFRFGAQVARRGHSTRCLDRLFVHAGYAPRDHRVVEMIARIALARGLVG